MSLSTDRDKGIWNIMVLFAYKENESRGSYMKSISYNPNLQEEKDSRKWFSNVKLVGEIGEGTSIYIEDYAYIYLHQYANSNRTDEVCAVLIGEYHREFSQVVIYGVIPVETKLLNEESKWIDENVLDSIENERQLYFPKGDYVGWMHTQPGYGIIPTTQEMAVHKDIFGQDNILMLVDPVYDTEAFFTCKGNKFTEKEGFCVYYEKNELMQKYMEDNSFAEKKEQEKNEKVVNDFRELGAKRKQEVVKKRRKNLAINITLGTTLLTVAFVIGIQSQQKRINKLKKDVVNIQQQYSEIENRIPNNPVELVFTSSISESISEEIEEKGEEEPEKLEPEPVAEIITQPGYDIHAVKMGESLFSISYNYYKTVAMAKEIAVLNSIENHDAIYIGQELKLPKRD